MNTILQDLSTGNLVTALEENLFSWVHLFGMLGQAYDNDPPGVKRSITDLPLAVFNSVMDARMAPEQVDPAIEQVLSDARGRNVPVLWWITPSTRPADLSIHLEQQGFLRDDESPGMVVHLARLNESLPAPDGLSIQLVQDDEARRIWGHIEALGFGVSASRVDFIANAWYEFLQKADPETTIAYIGWWNGKAVATSLLTLAGGVAGIYAVSTIPEARRRGIGSQITLAPLLQAREMGYLAGVLESSDMGLGVYRSLGFQEICTIRSYVWRPAD